MISAAEGTSAEMVSDHSSSNQRQDSAQLFPALSSGSSPPESKFPSSFSKEKAELTTSILTILEARLKNLGPIDPDTQALIDYAKELEVKNEELKAKSEKYKAALFEHLLPNLTKYIFVRRM